MSAGLRVVNMGHPALGINQPPFAPAKGAKNSCYASENLAKESDEPKHTLKGKYYSVVLNPKSFVVGYFQSRKTAHEVSSLINATPQFKQEERRFNIAIIRHRGEVIEYASGRRFVRIHGVEQEIKSFCDIDVCDHLEKVVDEAVKKTVIFV